MSYRQEENSSLQQVISQLRYGEFEEPGSSDALPEPERPKTALDMTWLETYQQFRTALPTTAWKWSEASRPGKHCDSHLVDFFSCIDKTKDKLGPDDTPEKFCTPARELTTACMAFTLCETKVYSITKYCQEKGDPDLRSGDCWKKISEAQNCNLHVQLLLAKNYWASRPDLVSTAERYLLLLGSPHIPGKLQLPPDHIQRRKEFLERALAPQQKERHPDDLPYV